MKISRYTAWAKIFLAVAAAVLAILFAPLMPAELEKATYSGAVGVIAVGAIGGFLKLIYDDVAAQHGCVPMLRPSSPTCWLISKPFTTASSALGS